jgi:hypothetical protein
MPKQQPKQRPNFKTEDDEREFWATHEISDYFDMSHPEVVTHPNAFPNLNRTEGLIELHMDDASTRELKSIARKRHVDLDTLAMQFMHEGIRREGHYPTAQ